MRQLILIALILSGCRAGNAPAEASLYRGEGRDRLCLVPDGDGYRAGLIAFGAGDSNCSLSGRAAFDGRKLTMSPHGDSSCIVTATVVDGVARVAPLPPSCAYYCAPGADMSGRSFRKIAHGDLAEAKDFAGDPLC